MIRYHALGTLGLRADNGSDVGAVLAQPMQVALLTYLALARPRGFHRRDTLLGLFWPELDMAHARGALNQAVYRLRGSLGRRTIVGRGKEELGIDASRLWCDAVAFETVFEAGSHRKALELYGGDLMAGFFLSAAPAWERWLEGERTHLQQMAAAAAWCLADEAAADNRLADTGHWGRRAVALDPGSEASLRRLIVLLDGVGDRAGAVRAYDEAAEFFARAYETEPSPETRAVLERVKTRIEPRGPGMATPDRDMARSVASAASGSDLEPGDPEASGAIHHWPVPWREAALVACLLLIASVVGRHTEATSAATPSEPIPSLVIPAPGTAGNGSRGDRRILNPEAASEYDRGRYYLSQVGSDAAFQARNHFQRALDLDPTLPEAWSGLSAAFVNLGTLSLLPAPEAFPRARAAAEEAIRLDRDNAEAHALLAWSLASHYWDTPAADRHFRRALRLNPNDAKARRFNAAHLRNLGRFEEALVEIRAARELDPLYAFSHIEEGLIHYVSGDSERAIRHYELLLRVAPEQRHTYMFIALAETDRESFDAALAALDQVDPDISRPVAIALRGHIYGRIGRTQDARRMLDVLDDVAAERPVIPMQRAMIHMGLGEHERALELLEQNLDEPTNEMRLLKVEPLFDPLHGDPRFHDVLRRVGLSPRPL